MATIDPRFIVNLKGKSYATWPGVLDAAHQAGLKSLTTELVQIPSPENGHVAIVQATALFEDGRVFTDYGDASPANTSAQIATASIRMAATRAKGRVLRDAVNIGDTLLEELGDVEDAPRENGQRQREVQQRAPRTDDGQARICTECGHALTAGQYQVSLGSYGKPLCPACQKAVAAARCTGGTP